MMAKRGDPTKQRPVYPPDENPKRAPKSVDPSNPEAPNLVPGKKTKKKGY
jgi:hypothetical protein